MFLYDGEVASSLQQKFLIRNDYKLCQLGEECFVAWSSYYSQD